MKRIMKLGQGVVAVIALLLATMTGVALTHTSQAWAADSTSITIDGKGTHYAAYKLLDATEGSTADGSSTFAYKVNDTYRAVLQTVTGKTSDKDILAYLSNIADNSADAAAFAQAMKKAIADAGIAAEYNTDNKKFDTVDQGYYLIEQTQTDTNASTSLLMLGTAGKTALTATAKEGTPEVTKKVQETNDSKGTTTDWQDSADYDVNDEVPFQLTSSLPTTLGSYKTYKLVFHDQASEGLTFNKNTVKAYVVTAAGAETLIDASKYTVSEPGADGDTFDVTFDDIKTVTTDSSNKIVIRYTATLNAKAKIGAAGNPNTVELEYSNNPNSGGEGETTKTPKDKVVVFTYKSVVNKTNQKGDPLKGAGFTLQKKGKDGQYVDVKTIEAGELTKFEFTGLDAGEYRLHESTVPDGYTPADDIDFTITSELEETSDDPKLINLTVDNSSFTADKNAGTVTTEVKNYAGGQLPKTGGFGAIILYVAGAALIAGAIILLVVQRRKRA